jgi:pimeloyl-ACP methyl ester carboxylesterase
MSAFVTQDHAALAVSVTVLALGFSFVLLRRRVTAARSRRVLLVTGWVVACLGTLMVLGAIATRVGWAQFNASHPPPGRLVDVGGYRIHVLCEGPATPGPAVLWIPGGYGQGWWMKHLHDGLKAERRSCLIDRAGTGWSDAGPDPRRVQTIVQEFARALEGAGERQPFVIVGHSLGGLLAVNFAALHPQRVAGVVALDPTPQALLPEAVRYWIGSPEPTTWKAWAVQFGATTLLPALNPLNTLAWQSQHAALKPGVDVLAKLEERPSALVAAGPASYWAMADAHGVIRHPGSLGALPLLSIVQDQDPDSAQSLEQAQRWMRLENSFEVANWRALTKAARQEYPAFSRRGSLKVAPAGTTHNFPIERPDFVLTEVRQFIATLPTQP